MAALLRRCTWLALPALVACRPPLAATPCDPTRPCPAGYTCDLARGYCAASVRADGSATDGLRLDVGPGDRAHADQTRAELARTDQALPDLGGLADHGGVEAGALDGPRVDAVTADQGELDRALRDLDDGDRAPRDVDTSRDRQGSSEAGPADRPGQVDAPGPADTWSWPDGGLVQSDSGLSVEASVEVDAAGPGDARSGHDANTSFSDGGSGSEAGIADLASVQPDHAAYPDRGPQDWSPSRDSMIGPCGGLCPDGYTCTLVNDDTHRCCTQSLGDTLLCVTDPADWCFYLQQPHACWFGDALTACCGQSDGCLPSGDVAVCTSEG